MWSWSTGLDPSETNHLLATVASVSRELCGDLGTVFGDVKRGGRTVSYEEFKAADIAIEFGADAITLLT